MYDRVPPHSLAAEASVLGACMISPDATIEVLPMLRPDDFYRSAHRVLWEAITELSAKNDPVDQVSMLTHLTKKGRIDEVGGAGALAQLVETLPTAANAVYYANVVKDNAMLRKLIEAGTRIAQIGYEGGDGAEVRELVDEAESMIFRIAESGTTGDVTPIAELLGQSFEAIEELSKRGSDITGLPTGFDEFDKLTAGLQPANLLILAARPGLGKSSFALNIAHYVGMQLRKPVVVFSLEMSKLEITMRLLSSQAGIAQDRLRKGDLQESDWLQLGDALGELGDATIYLDDTPNLTVMEIRAKARRLAQRPEGLSFVIIDYLQLMSSHRKVNSRQEEVSEISRGLKMLAMELKCPVMALSQLNRGPETRPNKRPLLSDLRESGSIEQDADIVMFLYRDDYYDEQSENKGIAELIVQKHRNGQTGTIELAFLSHLTKFANLARMPAGGGYNSGGGGGGGGYDVPPPSSPAPGF